MAYAHYCHLVKISCQTPPENLKAEKEKIYKLKPLG